MEALARPDAPADLADALASVAGRISITEYAELMTQLLGERAWLLARIGDEAGLRRLRERLARELGCSPDDTAGELTSGACLEAAFDAAALHAAARALARGSKTDVSRAALIAEWLADAEGRPQRLRGVPRSVLHGQGRDPEAAREQGRDRGHARHRGRAAQGGRASGRGAQSHRRRGPGRAHAGAAAARPRHRRALHPRQAAARRTGLRRPDRRHAPAAGERRQRRLGALQARRRHRPRAGRRGAGHQPRPVGGDPPPDRGVLRRPGRGRTQHARCSPSATSSSRSSASSAPIRASSRRCANGSPSAAASPTSASCRSTSMSPSARRRPCSMRSTGCSARTRRRAASPSRAT